MHSSPLIDSSTHWIAVLKHNQKQHTQTNKPLYFKFQIKNGCNVCVSCSRNIFVHQNNSTISSIDYSYPHSTKRRRVVSNMWYTHLFLMSREIKNRLCNIAWLQEHRKRVSIYICTCFMLETCVCIVNQFQFYWFLICFVHCLYRGHNCDSLQAKINSI